MNKYGEPVILAEGRLDWPKHERQTDRYGLVNIQTAGSHPSEHNREIIKELLERARTSSGRGSVHQATENPSAEHATFKDAPVGMMGRLLVRVLATRESYHTGDDARGFTPTTPEVDEVITLGEGELFVATTDYNGGFMNSIGLRPEDGRVSDWLNPHALYKAHDQTVELSFEPRIP